MRRLLLSGLILLLAGCVTDSPPITTTTRPIAATTTTAVEPLALTHSFRPGDTVTYDVRIDREVNLATEGKAEAPLDDLPASVQLVVSAAGTITFEANSTSGARSTLEVRADLGDREVEGTVDGEPLEDSGEVRGLGDLVPLPDRVRVDRTGRITPRGDVGIRLLSDPLTRWTGFLGPVLPEGEVAPGEEWSRRVGQATVTGRATRNEEGTVNVTGTVTVPARTTDLSGFYSDFLSAFGDSEAATLMVERAGEEQGWEASFDQGRLVESRVSGPAVSEVRGALPGGGADEEATFKIRVETRDEVRAVLVPEG